MARWLAEGGRVLGIVCARKSDHLEANARAVNIALTAAEVATLDKAVSTAAVKGERYAPAALKHVHK